MFKVNNKDARTMPLASFWCLFRWFEHISHLRSIFSIFDFEQVLLLGSSSSLSPSLTEILAENCLFEAYLNLCWNQQTLGVKDNAKHIFRFKRHFLVTPTKFHIIWPFDNFYRIFSKVNEDVICTKKNIEIKQ